MYASFWYCLPLSHARLKKTLWCKKSPYSSTKVCTNVIQLVSPITSWNKTVCLVAYLVMTFFQLLHACKFRKLSVNTLVLLYSISFLGNILTTSELTGCFYRLRISLIGWGVFLDTHTDVAYSKWTKALIATRWREKSMCSCE